MPKARFKHAAHVEVVAMLSKLDRAFLERCKCYFGGGTRIVLELGEYRESRDIAFLCASHEGYRMLRETVSQASLGKLSPRDLELARDVRMDQYGIRTWIARGDFKIKFEIIREARIDLESDQAAGSPVACLSHRHAFAEKFLANADRGMDPSTLSRDAVDLAFMIEAWSRGDAAAGLAVARGAYGADVDRKLDSVIRKLREDKTYRKRCVDGLGVADPKVLTRGLATLARGL
jgi:hypothetical protein